MREIDAHIGSYQHVADLPRADEALLMLRKVASIIKPMMRKRGWKVGILSEFYPPERNLLGLNINHGERILLRLRYAADKNQFMRLEEIVDTMLHELSHIVRGPHDAPFYQCWEELRAEWRTLQAKGYTGEGFLSKGHTLGGRKMPLVEMRRQARAAAEKRKKQNAIMSPGQRLGGAPVLRGTDMRQIIADAVGSRNTITKGCASGTKEAAELDKQAQRNGFKTRAEEGDTNDAAITQALIELMEEDEMQKLGGYYTPALTEAIKQDRSTGESSRSPTSANTPKPPVPAVSKPKPAAQSQQPPLNPRTNRPISRLVLEAEVKKNPQPAPRSTSTIDLTGSSPPPSQPSRSTSIPAAPSSDLPRTWECGYCTYLNPLQYLQCDMCINERPPKYQKEYAEAMAAGWTPPAPEAKQNQQTQPKQTMGWNCTNCGTFMENQWWTCSFCATMRSSS